MIVRSCIPVTIDAAGFVILNTVDSVTIDAAGGGVKDLEHLDVPCAEALIGTTDREHHLFVIPCHSERYENIVFAVRHTSGCHR